jgi:hypothetical protein
MFQWYKTGYLIPRISFDGSAGEKVGVGALFLFAAFFAGAIAPPARTLVNALLTVLTSLYVVNPI